MRVALLSSAFFPDASTATRPATLAASGSAIVAPSGPGRPTDARATEARSPFRPAMRLQPGADRRASPPPSRGAGHAATAARPAAAVPSGARLVRINSRRLRNCAHEGCVARAGPRSFEIVPLDGAGARQQRDGSVGVQLSSSVRVMQPAHSFARPPAADESASTRPSRRSCATRAA